MLKDWDLQNWSKAGLNMCLTADLYHWKSNFAHFPLKFTDVAKKKKKKKRKKKKKKERFYGKKEICAAKYAIAFKIPSPRYMCY